MVLRHSYTVTRHVHTLLLLLATISVLHTSITTSTTLDSDMSNGIHYQSEMLYISIERIDFNLSNGNVKFDTSWLQNNFTNRSTDISIISNSTINFTYSYSYDLDFGGDFFNISMLFWLNQSSSIWSMVVLQHQCYYIEDEEVNGTCAGFIYQYPVEIYAPLKHGYFCGSIPEVSNNTDSAIVITNIMVQAFDVDTTKLPPQKVVNCISPLKDEDDETGLIIGCVAGGAVIIAIVIVMATFLYRRRKRGQYNLLD